jgi:hypothetical protein
MSKGKVPLLQQLEQDVLEERPIAPTLRKAILLGGLTDSAELRSWASQELNGYKSPAEVPSYRIVPAAIQMDGSTPGLVVKGQRIGVSELPDFAQNDVAEEYCFQGPIAEIEAFAAQRGDDDSHLRISLPMARELGRIMASNAPPGRPIHIDSIYWSVNRVTIGRVVDQVRTRLAELLAELRAVTPSDQLLPTADQTRQAVNVVLRGFARAEINTINAGAGSTNSIGSAQEQSRSFWTRARRIGAAVVGAATIAAGVVAVIEWLK